MATSDVTNVSIDNDNVIPKLEPLEDTLTPESESDSSPEPDSAITATEGGSVLQGPAPAPKRKGGRKPVRRLHISDRSN